MNGPAALWSALGAGAPTTITGLAALLGSNVAAAIAISGTSDKSSAAYKTSLRSVQRYKVQEAKAAGRATKAEQARGESRRGQANRAAMIRKAVANGLRGKRLDAEAPGEIWISNGYYHRDVRTYLDAIEPVTVDAMLDAYSEGKQDDAWAAFTSGIFASYGVGDRYLDNEVDSIDLSWG